MLRPKLAPNGTPISQTNKYIIYHINTESAYPFLQFILTNNDEFPKKIKFFATAKNDIFEEHGSSKTNNNLLKTNRVAHKRCVESDENERSEFSVTFKGVLQYSHGLLFEIANLSNIPDEFHTRLVSEFTQFPPETQQILFQNNLIALYTKTGKLVPIPEVGYSFTNDEKEWKYQCEVGRVLGEETGTYDFVLGSNHDNSNKYTNKYAVFENHSPDLMQHSVIPYVGI